MQPNPANNECECRPEYVQTSPGQFHLFYLLNIYYLLYIYYIIYYIFNSQVSAAVQTPSCTSIRRSIVCVLLRTCSMAQVVLSEIR